MKKFTLSVVAALSMSAFAVAGGDIAPVEPEVVVPAPVVVDDSGFYLGVAYSAARYDGDFYYDSGEFRVIGNVDIDYNAIMGQVGYKFNPYIALEGRYWHSVGDGDWSYSADIYEGDTIVDSMSESGSDGGYDFKAWGIYLKPILPVTEQFDIYALLGYGNATLGSDDGDLIDENDFQWGIGASYEFTENLSIFVDYVRLLDDDSIFMYGDGYDAELDSTVYTVNVGLTYKF